MKRVKQSSIISLGGHAKKILSFEISPYKAKMSSNIVNLKSLLDNVRVGRANSSILDSIQVKYNDKSVKLASVAQIHVKDAHNLMVVVPDEPLCAIVEKSIRISKLGLNPQRMDSLTLKVPIPKISAETMPALIKELHQICEKSRVYVRSVRQDARKSLKSFDRSEAKEIEKEIQAETDDHIKQIDKILTAKETELKSI